MKIFYILILSLLFFSCTQNKESNTKTSAYDNSLSSDLLVTPKGDRIKLRYKFKKGDKLKYSITTFSENSQQIEADTTISTNTEQEINYDVLLIVKEIDDDHNISIDWKINSIISDGNINGEKIVYDSKYIFSTQERIMFAQFEAIKGKTFTLKITERGEILDIFNIESMLDELIEIQQKKNKITNEIRVKLGENFKDVALRPISEQIFRQFPDEPVGINSIWDKRFNTKYAMFDIENIASFEIKGIEESGIDTIVTISAGLSINWLGSHEATDQGIEYYFYDPIVSGSGLIKFNKTNGLILHSETITKMQQEMEMEGLDASQQVVKGKRSDNTSNKNIIKLIK